MESRTLIIELEPATEFHTARATVTENGQSTIWFKQPTAGWTTQTGWPAASELAAFLDYLLARNEMDTSNA